MDKRRRLSTIMTEKHPQWDLFLMLLDNYIDFNNNVAHNCVNWNCDGTLNGTKQILEFMSMDVSKSIIYIENNIGICDCEIVFSCINEDT